MLLQYYVVLADGTLAPADTQKINDIAFLPLKTYKQHVPSPIIKHKSLTVDAKTMEKHIKLSPTNCFSPGFGIWEKHEDDPEFTPPCYPTKKRKTKSYKKATVIPEVQIQKKTKGKINKKSTNINKEKDANEYTSDDDAETKFLLKLKQRRR